MSFTTPQLLNITFCNLSDAEQRRGIFESIAEIYEVVSSLPSKPVCDPHLPEGMSNEEMLAKMGRKAREFLDKTRHLPASSLKALSP